jgi:hypothetical protein
LRISLRRPRGEKRECERRGREERRGEREKKRRGKDKSREEFFLLKKRKILNNIYIKKSFY